MVLEIPAWRGFINAEHQPSDEPQSELDYQVTGRRIVAAFIDFVPLIVMAVIADNSGFCIGWYTVITRERVSSGWAFSGGPTLLYLFLVWGYFPLLEGASGRTLGKWIMGLKVVTDRGERPNWRPILLRNIVRIIDMLPMLYLVGLICVAVTRRKQRPGDLVFRTLVVRAR